MSEPRGETQPPCRNCYGAGYVETSRGAVECDCTYDPRSGSCPVCGVLWPCSEHPNGGMG